VTEVAEVRALLRLGGSDVRKLAADAAGMPRLVKRVLPMCAALLLAAAAAPGAATPADACTLLDAGQVSALLGVALEPGRHVLPSALTSCDWAPAGTESIDSKKVVVTLLSAQAFALGKTPVRDAVAAPAPGIGDEAYYVTTPPFGTALSVKKGGAYFQVRVGGFPPHQVRTLERRLALELLHKV
jgi:hypothetical protein